MNPGAGRVDGVRPHHGGARCEGYPSGVSSQQTPTTGPDAATGPRPRRLTYAAALAALEGLALVAGGVWMLVLGLTGEPDDRRQAVTGGVTLIVLALLPLLAARGLFARRSWSRGPAVITQVMALPVAYNLLRSDSVAIPAGIVLAVVAVTALVLLINAETTRALGIRGPGNAGK
ncbi:hypothetical protein GCM10017779_07420 [Streptomyces capillispiralis]|uniref:Integral membrane protein n=1 Tax=Streptomyces capillispiralis TaxID=68182 RepID=A0A561TDY9_9ACTN|nr:hypothetical protein FHX78_112255 [Streptomyces capillispiralis]GHH90285.1 hypothetical protein GCM10017779_07420 [Streptomyces capillispiralis]